ncbi:MAG: hypothetical protein ACREFE_01460 [Limisphaerales bacterium]
MLIFAYEPKKRCNGQIRRKSSQNGMEHCRANTSRPNRNALQHREWIVCQQIAAHPPKLTIWRQKLKNSNPVENYCNFFHPAAMSKKGCAKIK